MREPRGNGDRGSPSGPDRADGQGERAEEHGEQRDADRCGHELVEPDVEVDEGGPERNARE